MLVRTSFHLGAARLVWLDRLGGAVMAIEFAAVVSEGALDRLITRNSPLPR